MKKRIGLIEQLAEHTNLQDEPFPGQSLAELYGDRRILIEHHCGVLHYSEHIICVKMKYGVLRIEGLHLELAKMCAGQLVITGIINSLTIAGRK